MYANKGILVTLSIRVGAVDKQFHHQNVVLCKYHKDKRCKRES